MWPSVKGGFFYLFYFHARLNYPQTRLLPDTALRCSIFFRGGSPQWRFPDELGGALVSHGNGRLGDIVIRLALGSSLSGYDVAGVVALVCKDGFSILSFQLWTGCKALFVPASGPSSIISSANSILTRLCSSLKKGYAFRVVVKTTR